MRLTVLSQYTKALALQSRLDQIKWWLWHGDGDEALIRTQALATDFATLNTAYPGLKRLIKAAAGLATSIVNYSRRWRNGERISTAFVESTVNLVVGKCFAKKQQMQWSKAGAHLLLQTRTQTLDGTLSETFRKWYPAANDAQMPAVAA
jgi:hypothetical protein